MIVAFVCGLVVGGVVVGGALYLWLDSQVDTAPEEGGGT